MAKEFYILSWRRFITYLSGLSKDSAFFTILLNSKERQLQDDTPDSFLADLMRDRKK